jgi:hypothetical protein
MLDVISPTPQPIDFLRPHHGMTRRVLHLDPVRRPSGPVRPIAMLRDKPFKPLRRRPGIDRGRSRLLFEWGHEDTVLGRVLKALAVA